MSKEVVSTQPFQQLAELYLREPYKGISVERANYVYELLPIRSVPLDILDLGCGVAIGSEFFTQFGHHIVGLDISRSMLEEAKKRTVGNKLLQLVHGDIRSLGFRDNSFDVIISAFDVLNYLSLEDLPKVFSVVKGLLRPNGCLVFDFLTGKAFDDVTTNRDSIYKGEGFYYLSQAEGLSGNRVSLRLTAFIESNKRHYKKIEEVHTLNLFQVHEIEVELERSGFIVHGVYDGEEKRLVDDSGWHAVVLAKNENE